MPIFLDGSVSVSISKVETIGSDAHLVTSTRRTLGINLILLCPIAVILLVSFLVRFTNADLAICRLFYDERSGSWPYYSDQPWLFLFQFGPIPAIAIGGFGLIAMLVNLRPNGDHRWRRVGVFLGLSLLLGPGLIVNGVVKTAWGRPRPVECEEFGGSQTYVNVGLPQVAEHGRSFPSGHAATGFFVAVPALLVWRRSRLAGLGIGLAGISYGMMMGMGRIIQGRHFPSDVVWSLGITYFSALAIYFLLRLHREPRLAM